MTKTEKPTAGRCPVAWFEVTGTDAAQLRAFYADTFGWTTSDVAPGAGYGVMDALPHGIGGGIGATPRGDRHITMFIEVDDLESALREVERHGGTRVRGPMEFPDMRPSAHGRGKVRFAYFTDPEGNLVGLSNGIVRTTR